ncbi:MAG: hypothetical protein ABI611_04590 [Solirubrobacteraceae bacterium]
MTTYATNITPFAAPTRDRTGPILTTVTGGVVAFLAIVLIAAGAALFWVSEHKTDANGYYTSASHTYSTPTRALTTQSLDVQQDVPDWLFSTDTFGRVRIDPRSAGSAKPAFVGIARTQDVNRYLDQVQREEIADLDFDPFKLDKTRHAGEARPAMPAAQTFWAASSVDGHPLDWNVRKGEWSVVMMNADGSPGVSLDASVGAKAPIIGELAWWLTIPGVGLGLLALVLVTVGARGLTRAGAQQPAVLTPASTLSSAARSPKRLPSPRVPIASSGEEEVMP